MNNVIVRVIYELPPTVDAFVAEDADGDYNVYANGNRPPDKQEQAVSHELQHIQCNHLHDDRSVAEIEAEVRKDL